MGQLAAQVGREVGEGRSLGRKKEGSDASGQLAAQVGREGLRKGRHLAECRIVV